jgi:hypothetical protein
LSLAGFLATSALASSKWSGRPSRCANRERVLISSITACGKCVYCRNLCIPIATNGARMLGNKKAEFVRIPYAEMRPLSRSRRRREQALVMLSTFCRTGCESGVINGPAVRSQSLAGDGRREAWVESGAPFGIYTNLLISPDQSDRVVVAFAIGSPALASASALPFNNFSTVG